MIAYPVLTRSTVVKKFEFDDILYTTALLFAMGQCLGVSLRELLGLLAAEEQDISDLLEDAGCNHSLPFNAAVREALFRFSAAPIPFPVPSYDSVAADAQMPALLVELVAFNSELDEAEALYALMANGALDWMESDDFKSLPVPLNQIAAEQIEAITKPAAA